MSERATGYDVSDVEVFRKGVENVTQEMAITLMHASGSSIVVDNYDFCTAVFAPGGEMLGFSGWVTFHAASSLIGVRETIELYAEDPALQPGDAILVNDPYTSGAIHQPDVGIVMPIFHRDSLVGWSFSAEHLMDVGGSAIGSYAPAAKDVWAETLRFPPTRVAPGGVLAPEWERFLANSVRIPVPVLNDLRSMIAAGHTAQRKFEELLEAYGAEEFDRLNLAAMELSEAAFRQRVSELPDGVYEAQEWVEFDGQGEDLLLRVGCRLGIEGDTISIALSGDPQVTGPVNGAHPAVVGSIISALLCMLAHDIPLNHGVWRHLRFDFGPEGTVVNPTPPAPVTQAHTGTAFRVAKAFNDVLAQACSLSESAALRERMAGAPSNCTPNALLFGLNQFGEPHVAAWLATVQGGGGGAQTVGDGQDCYAAQCMQGTRMADVEVFEAENPGIVLYRRLTPDSGGPGRFRGGMSLDEATLLDGAESWYGVVQSNVDRVPARGFAGGAPGTGGQLFFLRGTDALARFAAGEFPALEGLAGRRDQPPSSAEVEAREGDVIAITCAGGGGLGDPLLRDPARVAADLREERVTPRVAGDVYGVVLGADGEPDEAATARRRHELRVERLRRAGSEATPAAPAAGPDVVPAVRLDAGSDWACGCCGRSLGPAGGNWRDAALTIERPAVEAGAEVGHFVRPRAAGPPVVEREQVCPGCATLLAVDVALEGDPPAPAPRLGAVLESAASRLA